MADITLTCKKCSKEFVLNQEQFEYLKSQALKYNEELIMPKICDDCRLLKEQLKSIPKRIESLCNLLLPDVKGNVAAEQRIRLIFGLARKEMRQNLVIYGFIKEEEQS